MRNFIKERKHHLPAGAFIAVLVLSAGCSTPAKQDVPVEEHSVTAPRAMQSRQTARTTVVNSSPGIQVRTLEVKLRPNWQPVDAPDPQPPAEVETVAVPDGLNPAVIALLNRANRQAREGDLDQSSASFERALRIEPGNAWLWHRLALVRMFQRRHGEAVSLATKSNTLAGENRRLQADNWRLIAQSREALGNPAGASSAAARARRLSR